MDVGGWLHDLGLARYEEAFRDNAISAEVLPQLTAEDLKDIGVTSVGDRRILLDAIAALRPAKTADTEQATRKQLTPAIEPEGEQRQVTVLFADLVGYTALSNELNPEELHALLGRFFEHVDRAVHDYGGYVDKHIGDCVMAIFGAPVAHGNDAERAVRAALAIRDSMAELSANVGRPLFVHTGVAGGRVVASTTGSALHREYTVTGESVNVSARLAAAAPAGEILISEAVQRALADRVDCSEAETLTVKGLGMPLRAWRLRGLRSPAPDSRVFVGRRTEVRHFEAVLAACRETAHGGAIYVRGEAGIGKTRLVEQFRRAAGEAGFACHTGLVLDFGAGTGRDAIRALVRSLLGLDIASEEKSAQGAAAAAVSSGLVPEQLAVFLNDLLDLPQPTQLRSLYDAMDQPMRDQGKRTTVAELVQRSSMSKPLLLTLEDLHWADQATLAHAAELVAAVAECPAVLVMTSRIEGDPLDFKWRSQTRGAPLMTIDLGPLRREEALALAGTFVEGDERLVLAYVERSGGHPLFLEQLLRSAEEIDVGDLPASLHSVVLARMDALEHAEKRALQSASVLGQRFSLEALRAFIANPHYDCSGLIRHHLVRPEGEDFLFAHALIQQGVYESLLSGRRRDLHKAAANWFADRDLVLRAEHLDRAGDADAPRAYLAAARLQAGAYRNERSLQLVDRGLALADDPADVHELTCLRGDLLHDLGAITEAIGAYERALTTAGDDPGRCRAWIGLAAGMRILDRYEEAFEALEKAEAIATPHGLVAELSRIHHLRGNLYFPLGDLEACLREHMQAVTYAREAGSPELEARALGGLADAEYARGRMVTAHKEFRRCIDLAQSLGLGRVEVANQAMLGLTRMYAGPVQEALGDCLAGIEAAKRVGHQRAELIVRSTYVHCNLEIGESSEVRDQVDRQQELIRRLGARRFEADSLRYLAKAFLAEGQRPAAGTLLREALAISRETGFEYAGAAILGALALTTEDPEERRQALAEGEAALRAGAPSHNHLGFYRDAIEASLNTRDWAGAERYAAALEDYTRSEPFVWAGFFIARGRALAAFGRGDRDPVLMTELRRLRDEGERLGLKPAIPILEAAIAAV
jgi:class 3 adenylate cyclase/tetratricopeptide (TPR) repeat protein